MPVYRINTVIVQTEYERGKDTARRECKMKFEKTIKIFLIDGEPNGRMTCELSNWTGKAYKIPRTQVKTCTDRLDLNNTGVYMLFGKAPDDST